jgi:hypothetical protein
MESNDRVGIKIAQPKTDEERSHVAAQYCAAAELSIPLVVDTIDDATGDAYSAFPDRLYIIDKEGTVAYKGGRGPFGYKPQEMEQVLMMYLLDEWMKSQPAEVTEERPAEEEKAPEKDGEKEEQAPATE